MKKLLSLVLLSVFVLSVSACTKKEEAAPADAASTEEAAPAETQN